MKIPFTPPNLGWLRPSNWPPPLKWSLGIVALVVAAGFGAYTVFYLYLLAGVLLAIVGQFWPLMLGAVVVATALGAAIGKRSGNALRAAGSGALYSAVAVVVLPLIAAVITLLNWQP
jgi:hypothetical protein